MAIDGGMRDKIAAIVGDHETADRVLQLFATIYGWDTPSLDDPDLQPEAPGVMRSYRTVMWQSVPEPAPSEPTEPGQSDQ